MFGYKIYRATDGLIKHDMWYDDDKGNIFVNNRFDLRDLTEETLGLIVKQEYIRFRSIELAQIGSTRATITVNGYVTVNIEYNKDSDRFEIRNLKGVVASPMMLSALLLSPMFVSGDYNEKEKKWT